MEIADFTPFQWGCGLPSDGQRHTLSSLRIGSCRALCSTTYTMTNLDSKAREPSIITVAVIDDNQELREILVRLIEAADGFACVGSYPDTASAMARLTKVPPDVALVDINMPGLSGVECVRELKPLISETQFVMLTVYEDSDYIFAALSAGATGYLIKQTPPESLLAAIADVHSGGSPMSSNIARKVVQSLSRTQAKRNPSEVLTKRENEVLMLLGQGYLYKEIAADLGISYHSVNSHVRQIYEKLQVHSRSQAVALFARLPHP